MMTRHGLLALALILLVAPSPVSAHGGRLALRTTAGPYRIEAVVSRIGGTIDESVTVRAAVTGQAVTAAAITISLAHQDGRTLGPFVAHGTGGVYEARYPPPPGTSGWTVTIAISGPLGDAEAQHAYLDPGGGNSPLLTIVAGVALFVVLPVLAWRLWWRSAT